MKRAFLSKFSDSNTKRMMSDALEWIGWDAIIKPQAKVFIKPNFTYPSYKPGVTTSPQMIEALISILNTRTSNVIVGESDGGSHAWKAEEAFRGRNLYEIANGHKARGVNLSRIKSEYAETKIGARTVRVQLPSLLLHEGDVSKISNYGYHEMARKFAEILNQL